MINHNICEIGYVSLNHDGEQLCGDNVQIVRPTNDTCVIVLADGLGSGVKANILSTLTAKMISTMMANNIPLEECVKSVISALPICKERKVAYSTFTIAKVTENRYVEIYNYDNPMPFLIHNGKVKELSMKYDEIEHKKIYHTQLIMDENDTIFMLSDGMIYAGQEQNLNYDWDLPQIHNYAESFYDENSSAKSIATVLIDYVNTLYGKKPSDDVTCAVLKIRKRNHINVLIGPSENKEDDAKMLSLFFSKEGKHIVCGGSTSHMVAQYLKKDLILSQDSPSDDIPPTSMIEGVDLVTEGAVTINKVLEYSVNLLKDNQDYFTWFYMEDGASQLSRLLFEEATDIDFFIGCAVNPIYQNHSQQFSKKTKMMIIEELIENLRKIGKNIKVSYF